MSQYRIAIFIFWFGKLPAYFPAWVISAKKNEDIDFFFFSDQEIKELPSNIHYTKTSLQDEVKRFSDGIGKKVAVNYGYKFCDLRPFIPMAYSQYLAGFDFWGYCDIDLVLGRIRDFLTDDKLEKYERFYEWGHLSVLKNNEKMNRLYYLPGSIYSIEETLQSPVLLNADEELGLNRICVQNRVAWYRTVDYADFCRMYSDLLMYHRTDNYKYQVFYWENGHAYRTFIDKDGLIETNELVYIHWQKRTPKFVEASRLPEAFYITSTKFIAKKPGIPSRELIMEIGAPKTDVFRYVEQAGYIIKKMLEFIKAPVKKKRIWMRQKVYWIREKGYLIESIKGGVS